MVRIFSSLEEWTLCFVTMVWGATFLVIRIAMQECPPLFFVGMRFSIATFLLFAVSLPLFRSLTKQELIAGFILGITVFLGFSLQTAGLAHIAAAKSAFITAFYIPLVPLFEVLFLHHRIRFRSIVGMLLSFPGVLCIAWPEDIGVGVGIGEIETIVCAIVFAWEILLVSIFAPSCNARRLVTVEMCVTAFLSFVLMPFFGETVPTNMPVWVYVCALLLGFVSAGMQSLLTWAQKRVPPTRAALIFAGEPVWAGLCGYAAGETISLLAFLGCILVIVGIVISRGGE